VPVVRSRPGIRARRDVVHGDDPRRTDTDDHR
jgi:hypothetical protein